MNKFFFFILSMVLVSCLNDRTRGKTSTPDLGNNRIDVSKDIGDDSDTSPNNSDLRDAMTIGSSSSTCTPVDEVCDKKDNDCDGETDEDLGCCFNDDDCVGSTCDLDSNQCIDCQSNEACQAINASKCGAEKTCIACENNQDCTHIEGKTFCSEGVCGACAADEDCANNEVCDANLLLCLACTKDADCGSEKCLIDNTTPTNNTCVACLDNQDCTDPAMAQCTSDNQCGLCGNNGDCSHLVDTPACFEGLCVACNADSDCNGKVCDFRIHECSTFDPGTKSICEPCVSDGECQTDQACIPTFYQGRTEGNYCLKRKKNGCSRPYPATVSRSSLSGAPGRSYCTVNESLTTCAAVLRSGSQCALQFPQCTHGLKCINSGNNHVCRVVCDDINQCPSNQTCGFNGACE